MKNSIIKQVWKGLTKIWCRYIRRSKFGLCACAKIEVGIWSKFVDCDCTWLTVISLTLCFLWVCIFCLYRVDPWSYPWRWHLYRIASLHPLLLPVTSAVLIDTIKETPCSIKWVPVNVWHFRFFTSLAELKIPVSCAVTPCTLVGDCQFSKELAPSIFRVVSFWMILKTETTNSSENFCTCITMYTASHGRKRISVLLWEP